MQDIKLICLLSVGLFVVLSLPCLAQDASGNPENAWGALSRVAPDIARNVTPEEKRLLRLLTAAQADALAAGTAPTSIILADGRTLADHLKGATFEIPWWTVDAGGNVSAGGTFQVSGTAGQAEAGTLTGGTFVLNGGHWGESSLLFMDGFETGSSTYWSSTVGGTP